MDAFPRRRVLRTGAVVATLGLGGCLGAFESYPETGLLIVNAAADSRSVVVRVTDTDDRTLYHETHRVPGEGDLVREAIVDTGPITVSARVDDESAVGASETFDFGGCRAARPVITVEDSVRKIGKQDACRPGQTPFE